MMAEKVRAGRFPIPCWFLPSAEHRPFWPAAAPVENSRGERRGRRSPQDNAVRKGRCPQATMDRYPHGVTCLLVARTGGLIQNMAHHREILLSIHDRVWVAL